MKRINRKEIAFTLMMVLGMVVGMLSYNTIIINGFNIGTVGTILTLFVPTAVVAFIIEFFFVGRIVHAIHSKIVKPTDSKFKFIIVMALLFVTFMAGLMSLYGTIVGGHTGQGFWSSYLNNFVLNWPFAFFLQLVVVGPLVRGIHQKIFSKAAPAN